MTDLFTYSKEQFTDLISLFNYYTAPEIKKMFIELFMTNNTATFKKAVLRRIIAYKTNQPWWIEQNDFCNRTEITKELVAIWKLYIASTRTVYQNENQTVEEYAHDRLEDLEKERKNEEID